MGVFFASPVFAGVNKGCEDERVLSQTGVDPNNTPRQRVHTNIALGSGGDVFCQRFLGDDRFEPLAHGAQILQVKRHQIAEHETEHVSFHGQNRMLQRRWATEQTNECCYGV